MKKYLYIKVLKNEGTSDTIHEAMDQVKEKLEHQIKRWYFKEFEIIIEFQNVNIPIETKTFYTIEVNHKNTELKGTRGTKDIIRNRNLIEKDMYDIVLFCYDPQDIEGLANWTFPNPIYNSEVYVEIPIHRSWMPYAYTQEIFHELAHACTRLAWFSGYAVQDNMDKESAGVDRKVAYEAIVAQYDRVAPYWDEILNPPEGRKKVQILKKIKNTAIEVIGLLSKTIYRKAQIHRFATLIQQYEGWFTPEEMPPAGSLSFRNNNPGNLRCASWQQKIACRDNFAVYESYLFGMEDLKTLIDYASVGKFGSYDPHGSIIDFFKVYAPSSDNNYPESYGLFVAQGMGIDPQTQLKDVFQI